MEKILRLVNLITGSPAAAAVTLGEELLGLGLGPSSRTTGDPPPEEESRQPSITPPPTGLQQPTLIKCCFPPVRTATSNFSHKVGALFHPRLPGTIGSVCPNIWKTFFSVNIIILVYQLAKGLRHVVGWDEVGPNLLLLNDNNGWI